MAKTPTLNVAVCQLTSVDSVAENLKQILGLFEGIDEVDKLDLVCLPENALFLRVKSGEPIAAIALDDDVIKKLAAWSSKTKTYVHVGSIPLKDGDRLYNASVVLTPDGGVEVPYRKIHLFDVDVVGERPQRESDVFAHGQKPATMQIKGWELGCSICYDLRFAELFLGYARAAVDAILVPSAFLVPTGRAHWEILLRARAIESQAYVLAAAQGGLHQGIGGGSRETYGHSMVIDPWGQILAEQTEFTTPQVLRSTLQAGRLEAVRRQIPMKNHRRLF